MEDSGIIELFWQRSEQAITETSDKYGMQLHKLTENILHSVEDSKECVNDTYHAAWNTIPPKRPEYYFAYIARIARHFAFGVLDYQKAKKRDAQIVTISEELENCIAAPDDERRVESEELGGLISRFLYEQSLEMRRVFVRRYWYLDSIHEIAGQYGMTESKVKSILFRMRNSLRKYLESEGIVL